MTLTKQDVDTLIDAVEAWEMATTTNEMMGDMLTGMMAKSDEQFRKMQAESEHRREKAKAAQRLRKEKSVMLRAKLIALRDSMDADAFLNPEGK